MQHKTHALLIGSSLAGLLMGRVLANAWTQSQEHFSDWI